MKRFDFPLERVRRWRREQASLEELKLQQFRAEMAGLQAAQRQIEIDRAAIRTASIDAGLRRSALIGEFGFVPQVYVRAKFDI